VFENLIYERKTAGSKICLDALAREDMKEGTAAFLEKRAATFKGK
jgi:hypothetical protein